MILIIEFYIYSSAASDVYKRQEILKEFKNYMDIKQKFIPHLTIARIKNKLTLKEMEIIKNFKIPAIQFKVQEIALFQSVLLPTGAVYYKLKTIPLNPF